MEINPYASEIRTILKNTSKSVELLNFEEEEDKYILHFSINNNPVKLPTDFNIYCYFESEILDMTQLNLDLCIKNEKTPELILKYINTINYNKPITNEIQDYYHIYQKISNISKFSILCFLNNLSKVMHFTEIFFPYLSTVGLSNSLPNPFFGGKTALIP